MIFLNLKRWRERGWASISSRDYRAAWLQFGGSVITHPDFVEKLSVLAGITPRYLGWMDEQGVQAAIAVWGRHLALSKEGLKLALFMSTKKYRPAPLDRCSSAYNPAQA